MTPIRSETPAVKIEIYSSKHVLVHFLSQINQTLNSSRSGQLKVFGVSSTMKFAICIVLLITVVGVFSATKDAAAADTAGNSTISIPKMLTPQEIIRIASALNKIVGPEHARHITRLAVGSISTGGKQSVNGKANSGARSRANSDARSDAGSDAGSSAGADCRCFYRPVFTIL